MNQFLVQALIQLTDRHDAHHALSTACDGGSLLAAAILKNLTCAEKNAYDVPEAFEVFIRGGGNPELYDAVSHALARLYGEHEVHSLLDIGAGDGMALLPALRTAVAAPSTIDIVEPTAGLRRALQQKLPLGHFWAHTLQVFVSRLHSSQSWDMAQSTFAMQSIPPVERVESLKALRGHLRRIAIVEFDVPEFKCNADRMRSLADRYENAARAYGNDAALVARGFLAPMLLGQLRATTPSNFEQPISHWLNELNSAGYTVRSSEHLFDYTWAPAWLIVADA